MAAWLNAHLTTNCPVSPWGPRCTAGTTTAVVVGPAGTGAAPVVAQPGATATAAMPTMTNRTSLRRPRIRPTGRSTRGRGGRGDRAEVDLHRHVGGRPRRGGRRSGHVRLRRWLGLRLVVTF